LCEAIEGDAAERVGCWICADAGDEADMRAENGEIVREDGGGAAEGETEIAGEELALNGQFGGKAVEDEIEIDFPGDGDVELFHDLSVRGRADCVNSSERKRNKMQSGCRRVGSCRTSLWIW
jgi:hypothetical protein